MSGLPAIAHSGAQIGRADEHAIDAVDRGDLSCRFQSRYALDLHEEANLVIGAGEIIRDRPQRDARTSPPATPRTPFGG